MYPGQQPQGHHGHYAASPLGLGWNQGANGRGRVMSRGWNQGANGRGRGMGRGRGFREHWREHGAGAARPVGHGSWRGRGRGFGLFGRMSQALSSDKTEKELEPDWRRELEIRAVERADEAQPAPNDAFLPFCMALKSSRTLKQWAISRLKEKFPSIDDDILEMMLINANGNLVECIQTLQQMSHSSTEDVSDHKHEHGDGAAEGLNHSLNGILDLSPKLELTNLQKQMFYQNGFVTLRNVVAPSVINRAKAAINSSIGTALTEAPLGDNSHIQVTRGQTPMLFPKLQTSPEILNLVKHSPILSLVKSIIGKAGPMDAVAGQIALRFPKADAEHPSEHIKEWFNTLHGQHSHWHVDGINRKRGDKIHNFSIIVGVYLADSTENDFNGNFTAFPGAHFLMQDFFRCHDAHTVLEAGLENIDADLPNPCQVKVKAGDIMIGNYLLPHTVAPNLGSDIRYAIYFRFTHSDRHHGQERVECLSNAHLELEGIWDNVKTIEGQQHFMYT